MQSPGRLTGYYAFANVRLARVRREDHYEGGDGRSSIKIIRTGLITLEANQLPMMKRQDWSVLSALHPVEKALTMALFQALFDQISEWAIDLQS